MADAPFTVRDALIACGVPDAPAFNGLTPPSRISGAIFNDEFISVIDVSFEEVDVTLKAYFQLTLAQGQIRLDPLVKKRIKAFIQWVRDMIRTSQDPAITPFPVADTATLIRRHATHKLFSDRASSVKAPDSFTAQTKWTDWYPTFRNYLRELPGRNGVPLSYIVRGNVIPDRTPHNDFIEEYVRAAPLLGEAYTMDNARVATLIRGLIVGNETAETKVQSNPDQQNGRAIVFSLNELYAGSGLYAIDLIKAEKIVRDSFYGGEKRPHMWWDKYESELIWAYATIDMDAGRAVYNDDHKIRRLLRSVRANFLEPTLANIRSFANRRPPEITFNQAMTDCRLAVYEKYPPADNPMLARTRRHVNEVGRGRGRGNGSGRGRFTGRGGHGRGGRGYNGGHIRKTRQDSKIITLTDGSRIEYHPSFRFTDEQMRLFTNEQKDQLRNERREYRQRQTHNNDQRTIQQLQSEIDQRTIQELRSEIESLRGREGVPNHVDAQSSNGNATQISQVTTGTRASTMMGGRSSRSRGGRS